jgi:hypothetical protein
MPLFNRFLGVVDRTNAHRKCGKWLWLAVFRGRIQSNEPVNGSVKGYNRGRPLRIQNVVEKLINGHRDPEPLLNHSERLGRTAPPSDTDKIRGLSDGRKIGRRCRSNDGRASADIRRWRLHDRRGTTASGGAQRSGYKGKRSQKCSHGATIYGRHIDWKSPK